MKRIVLLLLVPTALALSATPTTPSKPNADEPKTHALYLGADVSLQIGSRIYPVTGVQGESLIVSRDGKPYAVPLVSAPVGVQIVDILRLGRNDVDVRDLTVEPAYTPNKDPRHKFMTAVAPSTSTSLDIADSDAKYNAYVKAGESAASANHPELATQYYSRAGQERTNGMNAVQSASYTMHYQQQLQRELDEKLYDAMDIEFVVSSATLLQKPYVLGVAQIRERDAKPGEVRYWLIAKGLDAIGTEPRKVRLFDGGLPEGYEIVSFHLHIYDDGREVATPVAAKRVPLTADEAFQFALLEHLTQHQHDSAPASVAVTNVPTPLRSRLQIDARTYYIKITAEGRVGAVYTDAACTDAVTDGALIEAFNAARFKPAVHDGKPVESVAPIKLQQLL